MAGKEVSPLGLLRLFDRIIDEVVGIFSCRSCVCLAKKCCSLVYNWSVPLSDSLQDTQHNYVPIFRVVDPKIRVRE